MLTGLKHIGFLLLIITVAAIFTAAFFCGMGWFLQWISPLTFAQATSIAVIISIVLLVTGSSASAANVFDNPLTTLVATVLMCLIATGLGWVIDLITPLSTWEATLVGLTSVLLPVVLLLLATMSSEFAGSPGKEDDDDSGEFAEPPEVAYLITGDELAFLRRRRRTKRPKRRS